MLTLAEVKAHLSIPTSNVDHDAFLTSHEAIVSAVIEGYCGRKFLSAEYIQTFYAGDYQSVVQEVKTFHYPLISVEKIELDTVDTIADYRIHKDSGTLTNRYGVFQGCPEELVVEYTAGYATLPGIVKHVLLSVIEQNYNKRQSGVSLNFGSDVQSVSIPGVISIQFDYTLEHNQRKNAYGSILGNFLNVLDPYRSERRIVGSGKISYVEPGV